MDAKIPGMASGMPVADYCGWALAMGVRHEASHALVGLKRRKKEPNMGEWTCSAFSAE